MFYLSVAFCMTATHICSHCSKPFEGHRPPGQRVFCNRSCSASATNSTKHRKKKSRCCRACQGTYTTTPTHKSRSLCQPCSGKHKLFRETKTLADVASMISAKGKHPSWRWSYVRTMNRIQNKGLGTQCQLCGYGNHVEFAHIQPISSFPLDTPLSVVNDPSNILILCPNHHWEFDHGCLDLKGIPGR